MKVSEPAFSFHAWSGRAARLLQKLPYEWPSPAQYALAISVITLSLLARWWLGNSLEDGVPFVMTYGALLPLVLLVRPGPFLAAVILGWSGSVYLFLPYQMSFDLEGESERVMILVSSAVLALAAVTAWLSQRIADTRERSRTVLTENEARMGAVLEVLPVAVFITDAQGRLLATNPAALDIWGETPLSLIPADFSEDYKAWWPTTHRRVEASEWGLSRAIFRGEHVSAEEMEIERADGQRRFILNYALPVRDKDGHINGGVAVNVDITQRKITEETLRESSRLKDEFLTTLAHELRNPLAAIRMAIGVLGRASDDSGQVRQMAEIVERQTLQLMRLIEDLLDVSRIMHGNIELNREAADLGLVISHAVDGARQSCEGNGLRLHVALPEHPVVLSADSFRLAQVVSNLLSNACKFTDRGGEIWVSAVQEGPEAVVRVRDTGAGIPLEDQGRIFDMFSQVEVPSSRSGGLGIGLTQARAIVLMHGGTIDVNSEGPGKGSEFVVRIPAPASAAGLPASTMEEPEEVLAEHDGSKGRRILAVDDNRDALEAIAIMLGMGGYRVDTAADGERAIEKADAKPPDVMLLDISMPRMDGYEVARRIRRKPWGHQVSLIAMTGWGEGNDKQKAVDAGFDAYLTKPVDPAELERVLADNEVARQDGGGLPG